MANMEHMSSSSSFCPRVETITCDAPHNAVKAEKLSVFVGKMCLLHDAELTIAEHLRMTEVRTPLGEVKQMKSGLCYGLVGPNGCGKSTVLKLMAQRGLPVPRSWDVCYVSQQLPREAGQTPGEEVLSGSVKRMELLRLSETLEAEISSLSESEESADAIEAASNRLMEVNDELLEFDKEMKTVEKILVGLGFLRKEDSHLKQSDDSARTPTLCTPMLQLSGGWRMRVQLAKALWLQPKLLLLDEPTNHLDVRALLWLEDKLSEYPHTVVVVSHDISFLHSACWQILWINEQKIESMPRDAVTQEDLARMQRRKSLRFRFKCADNAERHGLSFHNVAFDYPGIASSDKQRTPLLQVPGNVRLTGTSRAVLLGRNGTGKSTFLGLCAGTLEPTRGTVDHTQDLKIGHYSQDTELLDHCHAPPAMYLLLHHREALEARAGIGASERRLLEEARAVLTPFGIENDLAVGIPTLQLSGGQKVCLKLSILSMYPTHILILDEPTNHLDAAGREALARGLAEFQGGVVIVTHDNELIFRLVECSQGELLVCQGGHIRREREWGTHRLHTLRDEVRKVEEADAVAAAKSAAAPREAKGRPARLKIERKSTTELPKRPKFEPITPPGFMRASARPKFEPPTLLRPRAGLRPERTVAHEKVSFLSEEPDDRLVLDRQAGCVIAEAADTVETKLHPQEDMAATITCDATSDPSVLDRDAHREKRIRSLRKKLQQIAKLKERSGALDADARSKVAAEQDVIRELSFLEKGEDVPEPLHVFADVAIQPSGELEQSMVDAMEETSGVVLGEEKCVGVAELYVEAIETQWIIGSSTAEDVDDPPDTWEDFANEDPDVPEGSMTSNVNKGVDDPPESWEGLSNESTDDEESIAGNAVKDVDEPPENWEDMIESAHEHVTVRGAHASNAVAVEARRAHKGTPENPGANHSRFRKDLINLNKAVSKWLKQEHLGMVTRNVIVERILNSPPADHIKESPNMEFQEASFLHRVLSRAECKMEFLRERYELA